MLENFISPDGKSPSQQDKRLKSHKEGAPGWLRQEGVQLLIAAHVMSLGS